MSVTTTSADEKFYASLCDILSPVSLNSMSDIDAKNFATISGLEFECRNEKDVPVFTTSAGTVPNRRAKSLLDKWWSDMHKKSNLFF